MPCQGASYLSSSCAACALACVATAMTSWIAFIQNRAILCITLWIVSKKTNNFLPTFANMRLFYVARGQRHTLLHRIPLYFPAVNAALLADWLACASLSGSAQHARFLELATFLHCRHCSAESPNTSQKATNDDSLKAILAQAGLSVQQPQSTLKHTYSRGALLDIAEVLSCRQSNQLQYWSAQAGQLIADSSMTKLAQAHLCNAVKPWCWQSQYSPQPAAIGAVAWPEHPETQCTTAEAASAKQWSSTRQAKCRPCHFWHVWRWLQ